MTTKLWGCSWDPIKTPALEAAQGFKFDVLRDYGWLGHVVPDWVTLAADGYKLSLSMKFRLDGGPVKATDITAKVYDPQILAFGQFLMTLATAPVSVGGKHDVTPDHEIDSKSSAAAGTPAELNAAWEHVAAIWRAIPGFTAKFNICAILVGWSFANDRQKTFDPILRSADKIGVDPYELSVGDPSTWGTLDDVIGATIDAIVANYPGKEIFFGEWGVHPDPTKGAARANWIIAFAKALQGKRYDAVRSVMYWNADPFTLNAEPASMAALGTAGKLLKAVPAPPAPPVVLITTTPVEKADLAALEAANAVAIAKATALEAATATFEDLVDALAAAQEAFLNGRSALVVVQQASDDAVAALNAAASKVAPATPPKAA